MKSLFLKLSSFINKLNRRRLFLRRVKKIQKTDLSSRLPRRAPKKVGVVLLIDAQGGWGDSLYVLGLIRALSRAGRKIFVAALPDTKDRYLIDEVEEVFDLSDECSRGRCAAQMYDIAVDTTYVSLLAWNLRSQLLRNLQCYVVACGEVEGYSNLCDERLDLSIRPHQSQRMAIICNRILLNQPINEAIYPYFPVASQPSLRVSNFLRSFPSDKKLIYINGLARDDDRCFSREQILTIKEVLKSRDQCAGIFLSNAFCEDSTSFKRLPNFSYQEFAQILESCCCVVSVDTSAVHLASALGVPTLAYFCGNDRDHYCQYMMKEVWMPLAPGSEFFSDDDADDCFFRPKLKDISAIPLEVLKKRTEDFIDRQLASDR